MTFVTSRWLTNPEPQLSNRKMLPKDQSRVSLWDNRFQNHDKNARVFFRRWEQVQCTQEQSKVVRRINRTILPPTSVRGMTRAHPGTRFYKSGIRLIRPKLLSSSIGKRQKLKDSKNKISFGLGWMADTNIILGHNPNNSNSHGTWLTAQVHLMQIAYL